MPGADPQAESQEEILEAALASLDERDIPPDDAWAIPDPDCGCPAELAGLIGPELDALLTDPAPPQPPRPAEPPWLAERDQPAAAGPPPLAEWGPAGFLPRDGSGRGIGFADGGALDALAPGVALAGFADTAHARLSALTDDELIGVLRGWQRQISWSQARKLATVAELVRRRPAEGTPAASSGQFPRNLSEFIADEVALALTLTGRAAGFELSLAIDLAYLPATAATLEAGRIDLTRARIIAEGVSGLAPVHAAAVEAAVLPEAPAMTAGQLRAAVARAVLAADPDAARRDREERLADARVECWTDPTGTANLVGRDLPSAQTLAADKRLCQIAGAWKKQGAAGGMDLLRARAYLALLLGHDVDAPPTDLLSPGSAPVPGRDRPGPGATDVRHSGMPTRDATANPDSGAPDPGAAAHPQAGLSAAEAAAGADRRQAPPALRRPDAGGVGPLAGSVHLTVPLGTLLGLSEAPCEAAGYGPLDPDTARILACAAAGHAAARWHITVIGPGGRALAHGAARRRTRSGRGADPAGTPPSAHGSADGGWTVTVTTEPITTGTVITTIANLGTGPAPPCSG